MPRRKPLPKPPKELPVLVAVERDYFSLRLRLLNHSPPFIAAMSEAQRREVRDLCRRMIDALDALHPPKESRP
jgi:hypothetical protein